jgi:two-component system phosphate regulon response regulator PhoB
MENPLHNHVLVVEDEADMARILEFNLSNRGCSVTNARTGEDGLRQAREAHPHLVMLDLRLPGMQGLEVLEQLKDDPTTRDIPVIVVSALGDEETVVEALNRGAEDHVTKPFRLGELMARVAAILRRRDAEQPLQPVLRNGPIEADLEKRKVRADGQPVELTRSEFDLLVFFMRHPGRACTRKQLCHQALGSGGTVQERTIDAHIRTIRKKLGTAGEKIVTVWGIGYRLLPETNENEPFS